MRFVVDAQLPPALARMLQDQGEDACHLIDLGLVSAPDGDIWDYATAHDAAIVTKDEDFAIRASVSRQSPVIIWLRIGNCSKPALLGWVGRRWPEIRRAIEEGSRLVEIV